mgnify:CR=1 FL=1
MPREKHSDGKRLEDLADLMRWLVAIELWKGGVAQADISKRLGIAVGSVNKYVKGIERSHNRHRDKQ